MRLHTPGRQTEKQGFLCVSELFRRAAWKSFKELECFCPERTAKSFEQKYCSSFQHIKSLDETVAQDSQERCCFLY